MGNAAENFRGLSINEGALTKGAASTDQRLANMEGILNQLVQGLGYGNTSSGQDPTKPTQIEEIVKGLAIFDGIDGILKGKGIPRFYGLGAKSDIPTPSSTEPLPAAQDSTAAVNIEMGTTVAVASGAKVFGEGEKPEIDWGALNFSETAVPPVEIKDKIALDLSEPIEVSSDNKNADSKTIEALDMKINEIFKLDKEFKNLQKEKHDLSEGLGAGEQEIQQYATTLEAENYLMLRNSLLAIGDTNLSFVYRLYKESCEFLSAEILNLKKELLEKNIREYGKNFTPDFECIPTGQQEAAILFIDLAGSTDTMSANPDIPISKIKLELTEPFYALYWTALKSAGAKFVRADGDAMTFIIAKEDISKVLTAFQHIENMVELQNKKDSRFQIKVRAGFTIGTFDVKQGEFLGQPTVDIEGPTKFIAEFCESLGNVYRNQEGTVHGSKILPQDVYACLDEKQKGNCRKIDVGFLTKQNSPEGLFQKLSDGDMQGKSDFLELYNKAFEFYESAFDKKGILTSLTNLESSLSGFYKTQAFARHKYGTNDPVTDLLIAKIKIYMEEAFFGQQENVSVVNLVNEIMPQRTGGAQDYSFETPVSGFITNAKNERVPINFEYISLSRAYITAKKSLDDPVSVELTFDGIIEALSKKYDMPKENIIAMCTVPIYSKIVWKAEIAWSNNNVANQWRYCLSMHNHEHLRILQNIEQMLQKQKTELNHESFVAQHVIQALNDFKKADRTMREGWAEKTSMMTGEVNSITIEQEEDIMKKTEAKEAIIAFVKIKPESGLISKATEEDCRQIYMQLREGVNMSAKVAKTLEGGVLLQFSNEYEMAEIIHALDLYRKRVNEKYPDLNLRIGLTKGAGVYNFQMGDFWDAIGDPVNYAARLDGVAMIFKEFLVVSSEDAEIICNKDRKIVDRLIPLDVFSVKGREGYSTIGYGLLPPDSPYLKHVKEIRTIFQTYMSAYESYQGKNHINCKFRIATDQKGKDGFVALREASQLIQTLDNKLQKKGQNLPASLKMLRTRIEHYLQHPNFTMHSNLIRSYGSNMQKALDEASTLEERQHTRFVLNPDRTSINLNGESSEVQLKDISVSGCAIITDKQLNLKKTDTLTINLYFDTLKEILRSVHYIHSGNVHEICNVLKDGFVSECMWERKLNDGRYIYGFSFQLSSQKMWALKMLEKEALYPFNAMNKTLN